MCTLLLEESYSSISSASSWHARPFCRALDFGTEASLSIICLDTDTMLSSMSCWPTSEMSTIQVSTGSPTNELSRRTLLGVDLSDVARLQLVLGQLCLLLDPLLVAFCQCDQLLQSVLIPLALDVEVVHLQRFCPDLLVQVHEHVLLQGRLSVVDADRVVVTVEPVDEGLNGGLVEVADVGCGLAGFVAHHERLWVDEAEGIDDDLALYGLDGVDDNGDGAGRELLERLLCVDIDRRQPAAEARM